MPEITLSVVMIECRVFYLETVRLPIPTLKQAWCAKAPEISPAPENVPGFASARLLRGETARSVQ
jgi:hypothetical protein